MGVEGSRTTPRNWASTADPESQKVPSGFTGHRGTLDFGLIDMGGRHYDAHLRRFLSPDPLASMYDTQGWARYAYARGNPNSYTDPTGFSPRGWLRRTVMAAEYPVFSAFEGIVASGLQQLLTQLFGSSTSSAGGTSSESVRHGWGVAGIPQDLAQVRAEYRGAAPSGAFGFDAFGADASLMVDQQTDRMVGVVLGAFEEERLEYKGRKSAQWSRLQAADSLPTAADALLSLADAAGNEVAYGQMHATGGYIYGTSTLIRDVMKGRWIQLGSNFAEGVGEHLGEVILGAETVGVGVETESPGLVMDGGVQVASGTVKLAGDAMMVRGALGGLKGIAAGGGGPKALPPGKPGSVTPGGLASHEAAFAEEIVGFRGGSFVGVPKRSAPGIDGFLDGAAVSLKETQGGLGAVLRHASKAETSARNAGFSGVELFIKAPNVGKTQLLDFAGKGPLTAIPNQGTISSINVFTRDGVVRIIGAP